MKNKTKQSLLNNKISMSMKILILIQIGEISKEDFNNLLPELFETLEHKSDDGFSPLVIEAFKRKYIKYEEGRKFLKEANAHITNYHKDYWVDMIDKLNERRV